LAGAISGVIATIPAIVILMTFGALSVEARILRLSQVATVAAGCVLMALAGAVYGRLFGRAANDKRGITGTGAVGLGMHQRAPVALPILARDHVPAEQLAQGACAPVTAHQPLVPFVI